MQRGRRSRGITISCAAFAAVALVFGATRGVALAAFCSPHDAIAAAWGVVALGTAGLSDASVVHNDASSCQGDAQLKRRTESATRPRSVDSSRSWATVQEVVDPWASVAPLASPAEQQAASDSLVEPGVTDPWAKRPVALATATPARILAGPAAKSGLDVGLTEPWPSRRTDYDLQEIVDPWAAN